MASFDVFNGDADGICALHQLRLAEPVESALVTGVKRDIELLKNVEASAGDHVTVLDISLDKNREPLRSLLNMGATITYIDHHFPGDVPDHPALKTYIDRSPGTCTSSLVNDILQGRFRIWAVVAAFGDNMGQCAVDLAAPLRLTGDQLAVLRELGEYLNYNAYGDDVDDLLFHPADLYRRLHRYCDPFEFIETEAVFESLKNAFQADMFMAGGLHPTYSYPGGAVYILPDQPWSRRVSGTFGNHLARAEPGLAHALLIPNRDGGYLASVRAPRARPTGADELCRLFETGGGRKSAAGINSLPENDLPRFLGSFRDAFPTLLA
ncbi:MAG TPA: DHH family phosphoesterase [Nitrosospira sp.]|nr:DHH family phosphoesterase [Nitrosospira sp.]